MKQTTEALVIWETKTGEADRVLTLLTPGGVVQAYAKNSLRPGGRLTYATGLFCYSQFELYKGRSMLNVDSASDIMQFPALVSDVSSVSLAAYLCELTRLLAPIDDDAGDFLSLALTALYYLNDRADRRLIKSAYELKILSLSGYMPSLNDCSACGGELKNAARFDAARGELVCAECAAAGQNAVNCNGAVLAAMRYIVGAPPKKVFSFSLPEQGLDMLSQLAEAYAVNQLESRPGTLDFYRMMEEEQK